MQSRHKTMVTVAVVSLVVAGFIAFTVNDYRALHARGKARAEAMERIRESAAREFPGQVINTRMATLEGRTVYRIQIADEHGNRTWLTYDVQSGRRLEAAP